MLLTARFKGYAVSLHARRYTFVTGVDSTLQDGRHILMWDYDDVPMNTAYDDLLVMQAVNSLPTIYILRSSFGDHFIAYCFASFTFRDAMKVLLQSPFVDWEYIRMAMMRGHFTLRMTPKHLVEPLLVGRLVSSIKPDVKPSDLHDFPTYETTWKDDTKLDA